MMNRENLKPAVSCFSSMFPGLLSLWDAFVWLMIQIRLNSFSLYSNTTKFRLNSSLTGKYDSTQLLDSIFVERFHSSQFKTRESNLDRFERLNRFEQVLFTWIFEDGYSSLKTKMNIHFDFNRTMKMWKILNFLDIALILQTAIVFGDEDYNLITSEGWLFGM